MTNHRCSAMSRLDVVVLVAAAAIGIFLGIHYLNTGELIPMKWRKAAPKVASETKTIQSPATRVSRSAEPDELGETNVVPQRKTSTSSIRAAKPPTNALSGSVAILDQKLDEPTHQVVRTPTNAVWRPANARTPGVRLAFP